jgi:hypothetical protein
VTRTVPPLAERQRRGLSETLPFDPHPARCQSCGIPGTRDLRRWRECDPEDLPTAVVVVLCGPCEKRLIEPHPRLYIQLQMNEPAPGCMGICCHCINRRGTACGHYRAKANGGPGVELTYPQPTAMHVCRSPRRLSGIVTIWPGKVTACDGREVLQLDAPTPAPEAARG